MESIIKGSHAILVHLKGEGLQMNSSIILGASAKVSIGGLFKIIVPGCV